MTEVYAFMAAFWNTAKPFIMTISVLVLADLITGVGAAIKQGVFDWGRVGEFYKTNVVPFVLGYLAIVLVAQFATPDLLGDFAYFVDPGFVILSWFAIVACIAGSIVSNLREIGIDLPDAQ